MSVYAETLETIAGDPRLVRLYHALSAGDRTILYALLEEDTGVAVTPPESANAHFWQCLSDHGWMSETHLPLLDGASPPALSYRVTDRGFRAIPVLLASIASPGPGD
jgi:hypothetical protein